MPRVLVTDASKREALAVIRSLGSKGIEVTAADSTCFNAGFLSKYVKRRVLYPPPERYKTKFVKFMLSLVKRENFDLLIPVSDFTIVPVTECKEDFERFVKVAAPNYEILVKAFDKAQTIQIASRNDIPYPETFFVEDPRDIRKVAKEINYPAVIKPRTKVVWNGDRALMLKVTHRNYAANEQDLIQKFDEIAALLKKFGASNCLPMVQEYVGGQGFGVEILMHNQEIRALFMHKRCREYPIMGGASTLRESVSDRRLGNLAVRLLEAMKWDGVAMVEFKVKCANYDPILMEVNGRLWGSLALAVAAGVDFPYLLYRTFVLNEKACCFRYKYGVKQRWLIPGDFLWLYSSILFGKDKIKAIHNFMRSFSVPDDIITIDDPAPTFGALICMFKELSEVMMNYRNIEGELIR